MNIRLAEEADFERILQLEQVCYPSPWPDYLFRGHLGESGFQVCEIDQIIVGYIVIAIKIPTLFERIEKRTRVLIGQDPDMEERRGHLMNLAIDPNYRRMGIARGLLKTGITYMDQLGAEYVELEVRESNSAAIELYQEFGFEVEGLIANYYSDGEDAHLMRLYFSTSNISNQLEA
jgi:ribosomal-protein-alanine N-acetyltransferase